MFLSLSFAVIALMLHCCSGASSWKKVSILSCSDLLSVPFCLSPHSPHSSTTAAVLEGKVMHCDALAYWHYAADGDAADRYGPAASYDEVVVLLLYSIERSMAIDCTAQSYYCCCCFDPSQEVGFFSSFFVFFILFFSISSTILAAADSVCQCRWAR